MLETTVSFEFNASEMQQIDCKKWFRAVGHFSYPFVLPAKDVQVFHTLQRLVRVILERRFAGVFHRKVYSGDSTAGEPDSDRQFSVRLCLEESSFPAHDTLNPFCRSKSTLHLNRLVKRHVDPFYIPNTCLALGDFNFQRFNFAIDSTTDEPLTEPESRFFRLRFGDAFSVLRFVLYAHTSETFQRYNNNFVNFVPDTTCPFEKDYAKMCQLAKHRPEVRQMMEVVRTQLREALAACPSLDSVALSFNGGKDCTVLLHAITTVLRHELQQRPTAARPLLQLLMIDKAEEQLFQEQELYVRRATTYFGCRLIRHRSADMKTALAQVKSDYPGLRSIFMGVRRSDLPLVPASRARTVQQTDVDKGWPDFVRVNPLLDWSYSDVWSYLQTLQVPYCPLYDEGYSSMGTELNTVKNAGLRTKLDDELEHFLPSQYDGPLEYYLPASMLQDENTERDCRMNS